MACWVTDLQEDAVRARDKPLQRSVGALTISLTEMAFLFCCRGQEINTLNGVSADWLGGSATPQNIRGCQPRSTRTRAHRSATISTLEIQFALSDLISADDGLASSRQHPDHGAQYHAHLLRTGGTRTIRCELTRPARALAPSQRATTRPISTATARPSCPRVHGRRPAGHRGEPLHPPQSAIKNRPYLSHTISGSELSPLKILQDRPPAARAAAVQR